MLVHGICCTGADVIDYSTRLFEASGFNEGFRTHEHYISEAEHIVVHCKCLP